MRIRDDGHLHKLLGAVCANHCNTVNDDFAVYYSCFADFRFCIFLRYRWRAAATCATLYTSISILILKNQNIIFIGITIIYCWNQFVNPSPPPVTARNPYLFFNVYNSSRG